VDVVEMEPPSWKANVHGWFGSSMLGHVTRKSICFERKRVKLTEIICLICSLLVYWAGLQKQKAAAQMEHGAAVLKSAALHFHQQVHQDEGDNNTLAIIRTRNLE
jgi:hypothetical protein